jgi:uncharacterized protein involved in exopolysaccharide biosynthesis
MDKDLQIDNVPQSNVVDLRLRNANPEIAADLLNTLIDLYIAHRRQIFQQTDPVKISEQRDVLKQRLDDIDGRISAFAAQHDFGDYDQALAAAQTQVSALAGELQSLDQQYASRRGRVSGLGDQIKRQPASIEAYADQARSQQLETLTSSLLALQQQRREAAARYADTYPLVVDLDRRIAALQGQIQSAPQRQIASQRTAANPTRQQLDSDLAESAGDMAGLLQGRAVAAREVQQAEARLRDLTMIGPAYREMVRNRTLVETAYNDLAKRSEQAQLQDTLSRSQANVRVIQRAEVPIKGKAGRPLIIGAGLALAFASSAAAVLFATAFREEMITPLDAERRLDIPVILSIPWRRPRPDPRAPTKREPYLSFDDAVLITRLAGPGSGGGGPVIQLIAPDDEAGVSTLALDLAAHVAHGAARRVLLIDVEPIGGRSLVTTLQAAGVELRGRPDQRIMQMEGGGLYVSRPVGAPSVRVDDIQWESVLRKARLNYDVVILDCPAVTRSGAGAVIAPYADMVIMVVEAEETRAAVARNAIDRIEAGGGWVMAAIFNKRRFPIPPAIYNRL